MGKKVVARVACQGGDFGEYVGFQKVAEMEWDNFSYSFNITGVWRRESDGTLWTADDAGCSCPSPWEDTTELDRLFNLDPLEERYVKAIQEKGPDPDPAEWEKFQAVVRRAFSKLKG